MPISPDQTAPDPTEPRSALKQPLGLALGLALAIGLSCMALALPRLATEAFYFWHMAQPAANSAENQSFLRNDRLLPNVDSDQADRIVKVAAAAQPTDKLRILQQGRLALESALAKAPARTRDWGYLAQLGEAGIVPLPEAAAAFRMAVISEGFSPNLTPWLFELGIRLWPVFNAQERDAFRIITQRQWAWMDGRTAEIAVKYHAGALVADMLSGSPEQVAAFLHSYTFIMSLQRPAR